MDLEEGTIQVARELDADLGIGGRGRSFYWLRLQELRATPEAAGR